MEATNPVQSKPRETTTEVRRGFLGSAAALAATAGLAGIALPRTAQAGDYLLNSGWYNVKQDFGAAGDGTTDDTAALQNAINLGASNQRPVFLPPGGYRITSPLNIPTNTVLIGSGHGLGFGCVIQPVNCAAFTIGGATTAFHIRIQDLMIWPSYTSGSPIAYIVLVDNSYSVTFRNIRIHQVDPAMLAGGGAAVKLLGDAAVGGHGRCNNIIWDNLIVRNDTGQPPIGVLATRGCGTHRFLNPDLESYNTLFKWQGGMIDWIAPYTERAGVYALDCDVDSADTTAAFTSHGGIVSAAPSATTCAIRSTTRRFDSYGTQWEVPGGTWAAYAYGLPVGPVNFHGIQPNVSASGSSRFGGVAGWNRYIRFPDYSLKATASWITSVTAGGQQSTAVTVTGAQVGNHWARATLSTSAGLCQISAQVTAANTVTVIAQNNSASAIAINGTLLVEACWA